jgi:hypothetical protein
LHGHEHHGNEARFGTIRGLQGQVVVVAAGSATGTETKNGWNIEKSHFNVIELHPDRTVKLKKITYDKDADQLVNHTDQAPVTLLSAEDVRRASCLRQCANKSKSKEAPRSRISKFFDFQLNRDVFITEIRTECTVNNTCVLSTCNRSGYPTDAVMNIAWFPKGNTELAGKLIMTDKGDNSYEAVFENITGNNTENFGARRWSKQWKWIDGAVFSVEEIKAIPDPGDFRKNYHEFVGASADDIDLEELNISVKLPEQFAPDADEICVSTQLGNDEPKPYESLRKYIYSFRNGFFNLRIPYPDSKYRYILSWPVVSKLPIDEKDSSIKDNIRKASLPILEDVTNILSEWGIPKDSNIGLYLPPLHRNNIDTLDLIMAKNSPPEKLSFRDIDSLARAAWWGGVRAWAPDYGKDSGMTYVRGETLIALVPIGFAKACGGAAAALLRVGLKSEIPDTEDALNKQVLTLKSNLEHVSALVLERCRKS